MKHTMEENYIFFCCVFSLVVLFVNTSCGVFHYCSRVEEERKRRKNWRKISGAVFITFIPVRGPQNNTINNKTHSALGLEAAIDCEGDGEERNGRILEVGCARGAWKKKISVSFQIHNENNVELSIRRHHLLHDSSPLLLFEPSLVFLWLNFNNIHNAMNGRVMAV